METLQETKPNSLPPEPQISLLRRRIEEDVDEASNLCQAIDMIKDEISLGNWEDNPEQLRVLIVQRRAAYLRFYSQARKILRDVVEYITEADKDEFKSVDARIIDINNEKLYTMEEADNTYRFLRKILKNSNLIELGKKSKLKEIENDIDLSSI